jgi:Uma2 family endonuclease
MKVVSDAMVRYPDVTVVCGPVAARADRVSPTVIFEILSPSTALTDQRVKLIDYASVASVQAYVTLEQEAMRAVVRRRHGAWEDEKVEGPDAVLGLPEVGVELPLAAIYDGVDFSGTELAVPCASSGGPCPPLAA